MSAQQQDRPSGSLVLSKNAVVPIGFTIAVFTSAIFGTWKVAEALREISATQAERDKTLSLEMQGLTMGMDEIRRQINQATIEGVTESRLREWISLFASKNPNLNVPELPRR